ncbi:hypothetical protein QBC44DRAFT_372251 [Cladorrhinum sp. PSN332]|nr:hypothetical protein QBC44DRAFT_372251 [Cladorrhinum sp. PSN332]
MGLSYTGTAPQPESSSLFASEYANGNAFAMAAGIDAAFGLALVVFICGVVYNWRKGQRDYEQSQNAAENNMMTGITIIQTDSPAVISEPKPALLAKVKN